MTEVSCRGLVTTDTRLVFDIESDGFLDKLTKIHCIAASNADDPSQTWSYGPGEIDMGIELLSGATELIAHNGQAFDILAIQNCTRFSAQTTQK